MAKRARGQEVIRQWKLLRAVEDARYGQTIEQLAELLTVTPRTIRRDIAQLQEVGFRARAEGHRDPTGVDPQPGRLPRAGGVRADVVGALRAVFQPRAHEIPVRHALCRRPRERLREVRVTVSRRRRWTTWTTFPRYWAPSRSRARRPARRGRVCRASDPVGARTSAGRDELSLVPAAGQVKRTSSNRTRSTTRKAASTSWRSCPPTARSGSSRSSASRHSG